MYIQSPRISIYPIEYTQHKENLIPKIECKGIKFTRVVIIPLVMHMKIGLPKALLYYRYGTLWETFFRELQFDVEISADTSKEVVLCGAKSTLDENCLPLKIFMGHVQSLLGKCDWILVPRFARTDKTEEYCVRFWGLPDLVRNTFTNAPILSYNLDLRQRGNEAAAFIQMGKFLGKSKRASFQAYCSGCRAQQLQDRQKAYAQSARMRESGRKILIASQPYLIHDSYIGGQLQNLIVRQKVTPLFSDQCCRSLCRAFSKEISKSLYWSLNKEIIGAVELYKNQVDGIILLTAFPCGSDSLVNELVLRKVRNIPIIQILLDEHTALAGLETRIESFIDILSQRRPYA